MKKQWVQTALRNDKKGALHRQLKIRPGNKIPKSVLLNIASKKVGTYFVLFGEKRRVTVLLKRRVQFALNINRRENKK